MDTTIYPQSFDVTQLALGNFILDEDQSKGRGAVNLNYGGGRKGLSLQVNVPYFSIKDWGDKPDRNGKLVPEISSSILFDKISDDAEKGELKELTEESSDIDHLFNVVRTIDQFIVEETTKKIETYPIVNSKPGVSFTAAQVDAAYKDKAIKMRPSDKPGDKDVSYRSMKLGFDFYRKKTGFRFDNVSFEFFDAKECTQPLEVTRENIASLRGPAVVFLRPSRVVFKGSNKKTEVGSIYCPWRISSVVFMKDPRVSSVGPGKPKMLPIRKMLAAPEREAEAEAEAEDNQVAVPDDVNDDDIPEPEVAPAPAPVVRSVARKAAVKK